MMEFFSVFYGLSCPILGIAEYHHIEYYDGSKVPTCQTLANTFWPFLYFLSTIVLFFIVPLIILIVLYLIIAKTLISNAATLVLNKHIDSYSNRARKQVILMLGTVVLSFFLCLIPFRVFILWIIIAPEENVYEIGGEKYYNILYFCRFMLYLNSAINPILYNLMSSKFRTGFLICSKERRDFYFKRSRNGTFSTTANSSRSSTSRTHHEGYKVCFRPRNNSIVIKTLNESPISIRSTDSHCNMLKESPVFKNSLTSNCVIDEVSENEDCDNFKAQNGNPSRNVITEKVLVYSNTKQRILNVPKCTDEVIILKETLIRECGKSENESLV